MERLIVFYQIPEKENGIKMNTNIINKLTNHIQVYKIKKFNKYIYFNS